MIDLCNMIVLVKCFMGCGKVEVEGVVNVLYEFVDVLGMV